MATKKAAAKPAAKAAAKPAAKKSSVASTKKATTAAKKVAATKAAEAYVPKKDDQLVFTKYGELEKGQTPLYTKGDTLTVLGPPNDEGGIPTENQKGDKDTVFFPEECSQPAGTKAVTKSTAKKVATNAAKEPVVLTNTQGVTKLLKKHGALAAAEALVQESEETYFLLGGILADIHTSKAHETLGEAYQGQEGYATYVEQHLGIQYRKAQYLEGIYRYFRAMNLDEKRLGTIGWSKAKELVGKVTEENVEAVLAYAEGHSRTELIEHIQKSLTTVKPGTAAEKVAKVKYGFSVFGDQAEVISAAIRKAEKETGSDDINTNILHIINEWAVLGDGTTLEQDIEFLQGKHSVLLTQVDAK